MESKYQVVSIKENPFQRAGDVTFRGPSPSFTLPDFLFFLCYFLSSPLPDSLSLLLPCSDSQVGEAFISLRWVLNCCFGPDPAPAEVQSCGVLRTIPRPFPLELLHKPEHSLGTGKVRPSILAVFLSVELGLVCLILVYMWKWKGCGSFISRFSS